MLASNRHRLSYVSSMLIAGPLSESEGELDPGVNMVDEQKLQHFFCARAMVRLMIMQAILQQRHVLTCHVRPRSSVPEDAITMRLAVSTTIIEPTWSLDGDAKPDIALGCYIVDFGMHLL